MDIFPTQNGHYYWRPHGYLELNSKKFKNYLDLQVDIVDTISFIELLVHFVMVTDLDLVLNEFFHGTIGKESHKK